MVYVLDDDDVAGAAGAMVSCVFTVTVTVITQSK